MKHWIDRLLSRWYVRRCDFDDAHRLIAMWENLFDMLLKQYEARLQADRERYENPLSSSAIVITTDYRRGTPCS